jgi:hypothetical protein
LEPKFLFKVWKILISNLTKFESNQDVDIISFAFKTILEPIKASQQTLSIILELQYLHNHNLTNFDDKLNQFTNFYKVVHSIASAINLPQKPHRFLQEVSQLKEFQMPSHAPSEFPS